jgi:tRNA threonylcarbamoyladenosine modification (KEOPS) complex Cgi121 subunit
LQFKLPEFSAHIWISGFASKPSDVDLTMRAILAKYPRVIVQLVDLDKVPGSRFLFLATLNALKSFHSRQRISKTLRMEILLFVSANRQINEALRLVGVTPNTRKTAALLVAGSEEETSGAAELLSEVLKQNSNDTLMEDWSAERTKNILFLYGIGPKELKATIRNNESKAQAIERLAIERSALLTVRK